MVCGLPAKQPEYLLGAGVMANLLGDTWQAGEPNWAAALATGASLHLYGKDEPRRGRKMGHLTAIGPDANQAADQAIAARQALTD